MSLRTLDSLGDLAGKTVIVRTDFNVPIDNGEITDDGRVRAAVPTIQYLTNAGAAVIVMSHLGRPDGTIDLLWTLEPVAKRLSELLGVPVQFARDTVGPDADNKRRALNHGEVLVLENLRFDSRETSAVESERVEFASLLTYGADLLVSDGFGVVHRQHASVYDAAKMLPSTAGFLVAHEVDVLHRLTADADRPYTVVLGGSKVSDKLGVIEHLLPRVDRLLIGGGMVYTFLSALGHRVGTSLCENDRLDAVRGYLDTARMLGVEVIVPTDIVVAKSFAADAEFVVTSSNAIEETPFGSSGIGLDIGPETCQLFSDLIRSSRTVFWNGPMGVFEMDAFASGTRAVATALTEMDGLGVVGGGDSAAAVRAFGFPDSAFGHISTGGGASLEFLEGKLLPGLEVLGW